MADWGFTHMHPGIYQPFAETTLMYRVYFQFERICNTRPLAPYGCLVLAGPTFLVGTKVMDKTNERSKSVELVFRLDNILTVFACNPHFVKCLILKRLSSV